MRHTRILRALCSTLVLLLGHPVSSASQTLGSPADREAVQLVITETTAAFNRHDAEAFARHYAKDARLVTVRGEAMTGTAEIEDGLTSIFESRARSANLTTLDISIRFIRPDVAIAHVLSEMSGLTSPSGEKLPPHHELSVRVFVKDDGVWHVTAFHNTIVRSFGTEPDPTQ